MFGFFNTQNYWRSGAQIYNAAAFSLAAYGLINNPSYAAEIGLDIVVHTLTYIGFQNNAHDLANVGVASINLIRLGAIYHGMTSGATSVPLGLAAIDAIGHLTNVGVSLFCSETPEETAPHTKQP